MYQKKPINTMTISTASKILACVFFMFLTTACSAEQVKSDPEIYQVVSPYDFEETLMNLDIAISEYNYRIIHRSHIGQAIRDRGHDDFPLATVTNFCNISYAHELLRMDMQMMARMSCEIAVWESDKGVQVASRLMDEHYGSAEIREFALRMNRNIIKIIEATTL